MGSSRRSWYFMVLGEALTSPSSLNLPADDGPPQR